MLTFVYLPAALFTTLALAQTDVWTKSHATKGKPIPLQISKDPLSLAECPSNIANATLSLPTAGAVEVVPGDLVEAIALGVGEQQYTCSGANWALTSVTGNLYDISCQFNSSSISALSQAFNALAGNAVQALPVQNVKSALGQTLGLQGAGRPLKRLGSITAEQGGQFFTFDFRTSAGGFLPNASSYAAGAIFATQPAPIASYNIDWLRITTNNGSLAKEVFQVQTAGGIPTTQGIACADGATDSVPFSAQYWFYKDNLAASSTEAKIATCTVASIPARRVVVILQYAVEYGDQKTLCTSVDDCTTKCLADNTCVGFSWSTDDGQGYTKTRIGVGKLGYSPTFTSGVVKSITNKQYVDRQGNVDACPDGQVTSADYLGCVIPTC